MAQPSANSGKLSTKSLREQVYERIKALILTNQFRPGQHISIDAVAADLGVSHTPVREALSKLELDGLISIGRYKTPRVAEITVTDVREVYEVRMLLEGWAAEEAARILPDTTIQALTESFERARSDARHGDYAAHLTADLDLHNAFLQGTSNSLFLRLAQLANDQSVRVRSLVEARSDASIDTIIDEHVAIVEALRARDGQLARERVVTHLALARDRTLATLEQLLGHNALRP